ncbi:MAG: tetratricopeptide repeat protein [Gemmatimonadota bacterium]
MRAGIQTLALAIIAAACASVGTGLASDAAAQEPGASTPGDAVPLHGTLGEFSRTITTDSDSAQAYFDQGMRLAYSFARADAARSFRAARRHDPDCAMCYWGEAWVLGPYQNNPGGVGAYEDASRASREARDRGEDAEPWERTLIEAMAVRYPEGEEGPAATEAYAEAMAEAAAAHGSDLDVGTLFAESIMMYRPWNLYRADGEPHAETVEAIRVLEDVLAEDVSHPGACHLYIHAVEPWRPERAEACADLLAETVPGVAHMQHMPSHIYMNIGRYGDAVRANQNARIVSQRAELDGAFAPYPPHNTLMLAFAAWMDGQSGVALSAARDIARERPEDRFHYALLLARFGRWNRILDTDFGLDEPFQVAMGTFARGLALLKTGDPAGAGAAAERIREIRDATPEDAVYHFFQHPQRDLLGLAENILAGEIAAAQGRHGEAEEHLRRAVDLEDGLVYSEPEPWPIPARHVLGAVLLEADQPEKAEDVYRESLDVHPENGWSLKGLTLSLAAQGRTFEAARLEPRFEAAWERADIWLPGSRF